MDETTKAEAIREINMDLIDSGNGGYEFETARDYLIEALNDIDDEGFAFVNIPSGYEVEISADVIRTALGI